jgi:hypothetical protein
LSKAGKSEADVRALADRLVREARSGKDFGELATINSDRESSRAGREKSARSPSPISRKRMSPPRSRR